MNFKFNIFLISSFKFSHIHFILETDSIHRFVSLELEITGYPSIIKLLLLFR